MALVLIAEPTVEPVTLLEAKAHLRVDVDDDDGLITALITAARQQVEILTNRAILTQTWKLVLYRFPPSSGEIVIPRPPLQSVTSVVYTDVTNTPATVSSSLYVTDTASEPGRIKPRYSQFWPPVILETAAAVSVTFVAGWTSQAAVPRRIKQAILLTIGNWYENRESVVSDLRVAAVELPQSAQALCWSAWTPPAEHAG